MTTASTHSAPHDGHGDDHGHGHDPNLAHHFHTMSQQVGSAKLGMWTFLATEILMFGGLFCAYAVYRAVHPEVFLFGHYFLDTNLGAINTAVLLLSSFTMAWAVRAAQLGQTTLLVTLLMLTIGGGAGFMVIKYFEYTAKFDHGLGPGSGIYITTTTTDADGNEVTKPQYLISDSAFMAAGDKPFAGEITPDDKAQLDEAIAYQEKYSLGKKHGHGEKHGDDHAKDDHGTHAHADDQADHAAAAGALATSATARALPTDYTAMALPTNGSFGLSATFQETGIAGDPTTSAEIEHGSHTPTTWYTLTERQQGLAYQFFSIYYCMTGLHGLHVVIGMGLIGWVAWRALRGDFTPEYNVPVDLVGLYWHLVDLIWIFLFPLLYLIH
ncbi:MAG: cytochrome c oxidase subunit 3 [Planctomycetota bacterium]